MGAYSVADLILDQIVYPELPVEIANSEMLSPYRRGPEGEALDSLAFIDLG